MPYYYRGVFEQGFPREHYDELEEYGEKHEDPLAGKDAEYYEEYRQMIDDEVDSLSEEHGELKEIYDEKMKRHEERFAEEREKAGPFLPDPLGDEAEIDELRQRMELIRHINDKLMTKAEDATKLEKIDEIREQGSPYWAERYEKQLENIQQYEDRQDKAKRKFYDKGEEYFASEETPSSRRLKLDTSLERAKMGMTLDAIGEISDDYYAMWESGSDYFDSKEKLSELLEKVPYEKANDILDKGRQDGRYTDENYYSLKAMIRRHYGK